MPLGDLRVRSAVSLLYPGFLTDSLRWRTLPLRARASGHQANLPDGCIRFAPSCWPTHNIGARSCPSLRTEGPAAAGGDRPTERSAGLLPCRPLSAFRHVSRQTCKAITDIALHRGAHDLGILRLQALYGLHVVGDAVARDGEMWIQTVQ